MTLFRKEFGRKIGNVHDNGTPGGYQNGAPGDGNITVKSGAGGYG